jgi:hypothetical protein
MERILEIKFQNGQKAFSKIVAAEGKLRSELAKLDDMAIRAEQANYNKMQAIGADVVWKAWLGRTKTTLNLELAQVLAQKEAMKGRVRREYGKLLASRALIDTEKRPRIKKSQNRELDTTISQFFGQNTK